MAPKTAAVAVPERPKIDNPKFFALLKAHNLIDGEFIRDLLDEFDGNALDVLATLIQSGVGTKRQLCQLWCDSIGIAHVDLEKTLFQPHIVRKIPERFARLYYAIPVYQMGDTVTVATATPDNRQIGRAIEQIVGGPVSLVFALPFDIETAIENAYQTHGAIHDFFNKIAAGKILKSGGPVTEKRLAETAGSEAINQLHVAMVLYAALENVSEIHLIAGADTAAIEYRRFKRPAQRIDVDRKIYDQLLSRLKTLAGVDSASGNPIRHGRIVLPIPGKKLDVRFENYPAEAGETAALKLTGKRPLAKVRGIKSLHMAHRIQQALAPRLGSLQGLFLLAGPAHAGSTTLAYALLAELRKHAKKIVTIEEQIKFLLPNIDQLQVNAPAGFTADHQLASAAKLRPDAIYLQDLPDAATVKAAADAAADRLVIAGMRAPDTATAVQTLVEQGGAHALCGVLVQRLAARLCDHCKAPYPLSSQQVQNLFTTAADTPVTVWQAKGCPYCSHTGFSGRIGIHELLLLSEDAIERLQNGALTRDILETTPPENYYRLHYDGIKKVLRGLTTLDEIGRLPTAN